MRLYDIGVPCLTYSNVSKCEGLQELRDYVSRQYADVKATREAESEKELYEQLDKLEEK
jgi:hypothetical protein